MINPNCVLFVASCDRYQDLWPGFFHCLDTHWPDNPFPVVLGANGAFWSSPKVLSLRSAASLSWSSQLRQQLGMLDTEYVLLILDDFFLRRPVDTAWVGAALEKGRQQRAAMVRLLARPPAQQGGRDFPFIGDCPDPAPYRICTQAAFWRRDALLALLADGESIWEFEHRAEERAANIPGPWLAATRDVLPYRGLIFHHVVEKGLWIPSERWRMRLRGIPCDSTRGVLPAKAFALLLLAEGGNRVLTLFFGAKAPDWRHRFLGLLPGWLVAWYRTARGYSQLK